MNIIQIKDILNSGFHEQHYPDQNATYHQYNFSVSDLACIPKDDLCSLGVELDDPATVEVSESNEVHVVYGLDLDCVIGPFPLGSTQGQSILKDALSVIKKHLIKKQKSAKNDNRTYEQT